MSEENNSVMSNGEELEFNIEAVLFYKTIPISKKELSAFFSVSEETLSGALSNISAKYTGGIRLMTTDEEVQFVTAPESSAHIEKLRTEELKRDIGKAGAETLAIVLYRGPLTRAEIDLIRGVNSTFILRNLLIRGLVKRIPHPTDKRQFQYTTTSDLLSHLGITKKEHLPEYQQIADEIDRYEKEQQDGAAEEETLTNGN